MARRRSKRRWIQRALGGKRKRARRRGALHRMLHISRLRKIPRSLLRRKLGRARGVIVSHPFRGYGHTRAWWKKLERRLVFALNVPHRRRR